MTAARIDDEQLTAWAALAEAGSLPEHEIIAMLIVELRRIRMPLAERNLDVIRDTRRRELEQQRGDS